MEETCEENFFEQEGGGRLGEGELKSSIVCSSPKIVEKKSKSEKVKKIE